MEKMCSKSWASIELTVNPVRILCPAYGQKCRKCRRPNHFAKVCNWRGKKKALNYLEQEDDQQDEDEYHVIIEELFIGKMEVSKWQTSLKIENDEILCKIDTGA